jgi:beta-glucosidase
MRRPKPPWPARLACALAMLATTGARAGGDTPAPAVAPVRSAIARDPAQEAQIRAIVARMTLAQKVGQMTQADIRAITPAEVRQYAIGSVLNGAAPGRTATSTPRRPTGRHWPTRGGTRPCTPTWPSRCP